jgi:hypothetical protein
MRLGAGEKCAECLRGLRLPYALPIDGCRPITPVDYRYACFSYVDMEIVVLLIIKWCCTF